MAYRLNVLRDDNGNNSSVVSKILYRRLLLLAAFIPIISGMSGNSGTQSLAVSVRNISTGEINEQK